MSSAAILFFSFCGLAWTAPAPTAVGVTREGAAIPAYVTEEDYDYSTRKTRVLVTGEPDAVNQVAAGPRKRFLISTLPYAPEGTFPPKGEAYVSGQNPEAHYVWRWIGMHAPDFVVVVTRAPKDEACQRLACQLSKGSPSGVGSIPAVEVSPEGDFLGRALKNAPKNPSPARLEIQKRLARFPLEVARQLSAVYGKDLSQVMYIPALALICRMQFGELTGDASQLQMVEKIVAPYFDRSKDSLEKASSSHLPGHLVFGELYARTKAARYLELARAAADLGFENGQMKESMPMHSEMSDSMFMGIPILTQVGKLTGETRYFDMAMRHMRFMLKLNLRKDGLHRHSPLDETAWGRGNGFPALGLALALSDLPDNYPGRPEMLEVFQQHMRAMLRHQDASGMWRQVVDHPESYRELTVTAMTAFAMERGVRRGWLDSTYRDAVDRAWTGVKARVAADGSLVDVCTGTGKQTSLRAYYDRPAILGPDPRGGAMAWMLAMELATR